jgi:nicotinamidase/pyrazinamidase
MACHFNQKVNNHKITLVPEVYRKNYAVFRNGRSSMVGGGNKSVLIIVDVQKDFLPGGTLACMASDPSFSKKVIDKINTLVEANVFDYYVYTQDAHPPGHISFRSTHGTTAPTVEIELKRKGKTQQLMWEEHCRSDGGHNKGMDLSDALYQDQFKVKGRSVCVTTYPANYYIQPPVLSCNLEEGRTIAEKLADKSFILWKGQNKMVDSYSAFKDADDDDTGLHTFLLARDVKNVYVSGIAREVCVYSTARDATKYYFGADTNITENPSSGNKCFNVYFIWDATVPVPLKKSVFAGFAA